jgi:putative MATE family efflux protein
MSTTQKYDLTTGSIPRHLIRMTIPMIWGIMALISFQLVDAYYISRLGTLQMASISYTFPVTYGIFSIFIGFGVATSSVISRMIGERKTDDMKRVASHSLLLVLIASTLIGLIGAALIGPIFNAIGASAEELALIKSFMVPYLLGTFFVSMPIVGNATLRASGDAVAPAIIMTIAALINAAINPLLIFGLWGFPRLELMGAAIGTIFANIMAMTACLILMQKRGIIDIAHIKNLIHFKDSVKRILIIALPVGITGLLPAILGSVINHLLSKSGPEAVAAFGTAGRMEAFLLIILMALSIGMGPIIGQNWGAGQIGRVKNTVKYAICFCVVWSISTAILITLLAPTLAQLFSDNELVRHNLILYLTIIPASYFLGNLSHGWGSTFNAIGKPQISASMIFIKMIILSIPAVWIGYSLSGVTGVFIAIATVNCITGAIYHLWAWRNLGRKWVPVLIPSPR